MGRLRVRRLASAEPVNPAGRTRTGAAPWSVAGRVGAASRLDLESRIALAADLQHSVGNAAATRLVGLIQTDRRKEPPGGAREISEAGSGGARGRTRTSYADNPPIFLTGNVEESGGTWSTRPQEVRLPSLDHEVFYPAPGRHRLRDLGGSAGLYLDVTDDWSARILQGEQEHVDDIEQAWQMTWGRIANVINEMANGGPFTGKTGEEARAAAWREFQRRLPAALRPAGDTPTPQAQLAKWGVQDQGTIFRKLMRETRRARDDSQWHTPDQNLKGMEGNDQIDELAVGTSRIGQVPSQRLMSEAWDRLARG